MSDMLLSVDTIPLPWRRIVQLAERDPRRAAAIAQRVQRQPHDPTAAAWAAFTTGWTSLRWERFDAARTALSEAERQFAALGLAVPQLHCRFGRLLTDLWTGARSLAEDDWQSLAADYAAAGQPGGAIPVLLHRAVYLNSRDGHRAARELTAMLTPQAAALREPALGARIQRVASLAHEVSGDPRHAELLLDQAAATFAAHRLPIEVARCRLERAWQLQRRERFDAALAELQLAATTFRRFDLPLSAAHATRSLGVVSLRLGRYGRALAETLRARATFAHLGRTDLAADCDMTLGNVGYYAQLLDLALSAYRRAQDEYRRLGKERLVLQSQRNQALALRAQGASAEALALLDPLVVRFEAIGDQLEAAESMQAMAQALADLGRTDEALAQSAAAEERFAALGNLPGAAKGALQQGWIHLDLQHNEAARSCLELARDRLRELPVHVWRAEYGLGRLAERERRTEAALAHYRAASEVVMRLRTTLANEHASSGIFSQAQALFSDALQLSAAMGDARHVFTLAEQQRALALLLQVRSGPGLLPPALRAAHGERRAALRELDPAAPSNASDGAMQRYTELLLHAQSLHAIADDGAVGQIDLERLRVQLDDAYPAGWSVLTYVRSGDDLLAVTVERDACGTERIPIDAQLRRLMDRATLPRYRSHTYLDLPHAHDPAVPPWQTLTELGERLIPERLRGSIDPGHRLLIIPDGMLHAIPWAALRVDGGWLCERAVIQILPSLALWEALQARRPRTARALLVGCSAFQGRAADLPHIPSELDLVAERWSGEVRQLRDADATTEALRSLASEGELRACRLIHLASHAQLVSRRGAMAHIKLWDDDLWLDDVARLAIGGAAVVMTTCDGASSDVLPGEELLGLSWALLAAGARDVVASMWSVRDGATLGLLGHVYEHLGRGRDPAEALALAQRAVLAGRDNDSLRSSPLVWAHFCAIGACSATEVAEVGTTPADTMVTSSGGS